VGAPLTAGVAAALCVVLGQLVVAGTVRTSARRRAVRRLRGAAAEPGPQRRRSGGSPRPARARPVRVPAPLDRFLGGPDRRARRADRHLPALLDQVTRHLRSGSSLPVAVQSSASDATDPSTGALAADLVAGAPLAGAVTRWQAVSPTPARRLAAAALVLAAEAGGSVAVVLDGVNDTLRDRVALEREVAALSSQARASAAVLVVAPVVFAALAGAVDHRVVEAVVASPLGWACLSAGVLLDGLGALWMARLVGRVR
jgi:tight adherence protein B